MTGAGGQISGHGSARGRRRFPLHDDCGNGWKRDHLSVLEAHVE